MMEHSKFIRIRNALLPVFLLLFLTSCATGPDIIGKWREIGREATLAFSADGTFQAVDNQGMAVSGRYTLFPDGRLRCEIDHTGDEKEVVDLMLTAEGDELILTSSDTPEVERYGRVK